MTTTGPTQHFVASQRLRLSYWSWGERSRPPLILLHGKRDQARSWDALAAELQGEWHVAAADLRGHGDSQWAVGSHYAFADYIADLVALIEALGAPASLVGHSGGGLVATLTAGLYPGHVRRVVAIEGTGAHLQRLPRAGPDAMREWVDHTRSLEDRPGRILPTVAAAAERMRRGNPRLSPERARELAAHAVRPADGGFRWKFDPWVDSSNPVELRPEEAPPIWARVVCPVLLLVGDEAAGRGVQSPGDASYFPDARATVVADAGHWVHHDQPAAVLEAIRRFADGDL